MSLAASKAPELELDDKTATSFVSWFNKLPKDDRILRVFDRKGFFSVHGPDAGSIAQSFYKGTGVLKQLGKAPASLSSITLNRSMFDQLLRSVLVEQADRIVEVYEGHGATWRLDRQGSPGRLGAFEDELFSSAEMVDAAIVLACTSAMVDGVRMVGVAYLDAAACRLGATEFADDEQLCCLDRVLVQLGAREVVIPQDSAANKVDNEKMEVVATDCGALVSRRPRASFNGKDVRDTIATLVKAGTIQQYEDVLERPLACGAIAAVLAFTDALGNSANHGKFKVELYRPDEFMRLDAAAQRALHVFPARTGATGSGSVYGVLNRTRTAMGKRLLRCWLKQPLTDVAAIRQRHDVVDAFVQDLEMRESVRDGHLRGLPDLQRLCRKLSNKKISLQELCQLYMASNRLPVLADALATHTGTSADLLNEKYVQPLLRAHSEEALTKFEELLEAAIDLEAVPEEYLIDSSYDASLQEVKALRDQAVQAIQNDAQAIADDLSLELDKDIKLEWHKANLVSVRCMRITQKQEKLLRSKLNAKYIVVETRKDGTKFTSKRMKEHAIQLNDFTKQYSTLQKSLVDSVIDVAATFVPVWEAVSELIAELDCLAGFADLAGCSPAPYVRPELLGGEQGVLELLGSRHPCIEAQDAVEFIPNDCAMARGESWFQVITGPNMGGKSTYIRQVGVCVLMAQVGAFVPCDSAKISVRDCIFARVGAGDSQQKGVSTFMAEMLETAAILKGATDRSLLIIDELGRGTSTYDGFGLAWALSEHIMQVIGAPTLFATHFHELTAISGSVGVKNRHMETALDTAAGTLTMLYRVADGACDQSFGIHVAQFASFPPEVVERAKVKLAELEASSVNYSAHAEVGAKRPRSADEDAEWEKQAAAAIKAFVFDFAGLPKQDLSDEQFASRALELKSSLQEQATANPVLQGLLRQAMAAPALAS